MKNPYLIIIMIPDTQVIQNSVANNLISGMTTGNQIIDLLISLVISCIVASLFSKLPSLFTKDFWNKIKNRLKKKYTIRISDKQCLTDKSGWTSDPENGKHNKRLIKAIKEFINKLNLKNLNERIILGETKESTNRYLQELSRDIIGIPIGKFTLPKPYDDIQIRIWSESENGDQVINKTFSEFITIETETSIQRLRDFLDICFKKWVETHFEIYKKKKDKYMFSFHHNPKLGLSDNLFNVYRIDPTIQFTDIFFPEKNRALRLIDKFNQNKLKTNKLSFLLHGPPGTGKTSFIKALSNYTDRSIAYVKLSEIKSMHDAMTIFFKEEIWEFYARLYNRYEIPLNKRIYVLEDIDADNQIVHRRKKDTVKDGDDDDNTEDDKNDNKEEKEQIKLSDILQILDGINELKGAIVVMTTNHIEKLDPALIRPGRVTMKIHMRELTKDHALEMINHHFPTELPHEATLDISNFDFITDYSLTPALLECFCQEAENREQLYELLMNFYLNNS